jgi:4-alpha-glucanotransferase
VPLRDRDPQAIDAARRQFARHILRHQYLQWTAEEQWQAARSAAEVHGVAVFGDLPFVVNLHSADVWARADEFLLDVSVGVPPDAFSATGQDWGLPAYRWDLVAARDYAWIRQRARRMASLFTGFRVDHVIGFYRMYGRPPEGDPFFSPPDEASQTRQGEAILRIFLETGAAFIAEDLGTVPDFLRPSLTRLGVAGCKVLRWERRWLEPGQPFVDPADYPPLSCALTGTHDTDTLADWWNAAGLEERTQLLRLPALRDRRFVAASPWNDALRDALLELACSAASRDLFVVVQDLFGWEDRVNTPATVSDHNWTWRMPWPVDRLIDTPAAVARATFFQTLTLRRPCR